MQRTRRPHRRAVVRDGEPRGIDAHVRPDSAAKISRLHSSSISVYSQLSYLPIILPEDEAREKKYSIHALHCSKAREIAAHYNEVRAKEAVRIEYTMNHHASRRPCLQIRCEGAER